MDQHSRDEIVAAAAAHAELGPGYDDAVAEGLVERIGTEIDRRVEAGFAQRDRRRAARRGPASWPPVAMGLGSVALGTAATVAVLHPWGGYGNSGETLTLPPDRAVTLPGFPLRPAAAAPVTGGQVVLVALIWVIIAVIYVAYTRQHRQPPRYHLTEG
jgi:hypothetical protein